LADLLIVDLDRDLHFASQSCRALSDPVQPAGTSGKPELAGAKST